MMLQVLAPQAQHPALEHAMCCASQTEYPRLRCQGAVTRMSILQRNLQSPASAFPSSACHTPAPCGPILLSTSNTQVAALGSHPKACRGAFAASHAPCHCCRNRSRGGFKPCHASVLKLATLTRAACTLIVPSGTQGMDEIPLTPGSHLMPDLLGAPSKPKEDRTWSPRFLTR